jgi:hypothetical protein
LIGIHNEHFLHHRRSGCYHPCCKLPGFARLKVSSAPLLDVVGCNGSRGHSVVFHKTPDGQCSAPALGFFFLYSITSSAQSCSECTMVITLGHTTFASRLSVRAGT